MTFGDIRNFTPAESYSGFSKTSFNKMLFKKKLK